MFNNSNKNIIVKIYLMSHVFRFLKPVFACHSIPQPTVHSLLAEFCDTSCFLLFSFFSFLVEPIQEAVQCSCAAHFICFVSIRGQGESSNLAYNRCEIRDKRTLGRGPDRSWCYLHTSVKLFWSQPMAAWTGGSIRVAIVQSMDP